MRTVVDTDILASAVDDAHHVLQVRGAHPDGALRWA
jgi:hypothetical protein